jgi:biopolymer transport protein ExbD
MPRNLGKRKKTWVDDENLINLTPLIDVVFVVLIMFILIAPMLNLDHVELAQSKKNSNSVSNNSSKSITIHVKEDDTLWVNARQVHLNDLPLYLSQIKSKQNFEAIQLFQDNRSSFGTYQTIKNAAEIAGFDYLDVILKPS